MNAPDNKKPLPSARFDFNKAAQRIVRDHPELKGNTVFIDLATDKRHGPLKARIKARMSKPFRDSVAEAKKKAALLKNTGAGFAVKNKDGMNALILTLDRDFYFVADVQRNKDMDAMYAFHHEAAHLVVPSASPGNAANLPYSKQEGAADAYAVIRHYQTYGADAAEVERASMRRSLDFIQHGRPEYMTTFIIDKVIKDRKTLTAANLSPQQVVQVTESYAARFTPTNQQIDRMLKDFEPLKGQIGAATKENTAPLKKLADIALDPNSSPLTFYVANRVLGELLGRMLQGPEWAVIAMRLHEKEKAFTLERLFPEKSAASVTPKKKAA